MSVARSAATAGGTVEPGQLGLPADLLRWVSERAGAVDRNAADPFDVVAALAERGQLDRCVSAPDAIHASAAAIRELARVCMSSAFVTWSHRMTIEYLRHGAHETFREDVLPSLLTGRRPGSTALASAFRDAAGMAELPVVAHQVDGGLRLEGHIPWASNLRDDAVMVLGVRGADGERALVALDVGTAGVTVSPATDLLGLSATRSGRIELDGAFVPARQKLTVEFRPFLRAVRPTFLLLQCALCLGLVDSALGNDDVAPAAVFAADLDDARARRDALSAQIDALLDDAAVARTAGADVPIRPYLEARLAGARLAGAATQLELRLAGGRGYVQSSATARRVREALFLPVQSPTEAQLLWELSQYS